MNYIVTYEQEVRGTHDGYRMKLSQVFNGAELIDLVKNTNVVILLMQEVK